MPKRPAGHLPLPSYVSWVRLPESRGGGVLYELPGEVPGWTVAAHVVEQDGEGVIAELRLYPQRSGLRTIDALDRRKQRRQAGKWDPSDPIPKGGITARLVNRELRVSEILRKCWALAARIHAMSIEPPLRTTSQRRVSDRPIVPSKRDIKRASSHSRPLGRPPNDDTEYLATAIHFHVLVNQQRPDPKPITTLSDKLGRTYTSMRDEIRTCRNRQLLTSPGRGRVGGRLTAKAWKLIKEHPDREDLLALLERLEE